MQVKEEFMFRIGEFSKLAKTTVKTLRFYDEIGLFKPAFVDDNGYRYYSIEQLSKLQLIVELRSYDLPVDDVKKILRGGNVEKTLADRKHELKKELENGRKNLTLIEKLLTSVKKGEFMKNYEAKLVTIPEYIVYYRTGVIPTMADLFPFVLGAGEECRENNPNVECEDYCYVTYGANEYQEKNVEVEYVEAIKSFGKESENIKFRKIPEIKAISVDHKGPYEKLGEAYAYAVNWVKENGYEIDGRIRESYVHGCWDCESEDDYLTVLQVPVK